MESVTVGGLLSRSIETFRVNFMAFFLIGTLAAVTSNGLVLYLDLDWMLTGEIDTDNIEEIQGMAASLLSASAGIVVLYTFAYAAITFGTVRFLANDPATVGECLARGVWLLLPLIGMGLVLLIGFSVVAGIVAAFLSPNAQLVLIAPAAYILLVLYVSVPALVAEKIGVFKAFARSAALTKGARLRILGLVAIIYAIGIIVAIVVGLVTSGFPLVKLVAGSLIDGLLLAFGAVAATVVYDALYHAKFEPEITGTFD